MPEEVKALAGQNLEELFDVVDAEDRVIGRASRREVHARQLLHRAIHVLLHNARGEFFLHQRSRWKDVCPLVWSMSCSGHVDAGEDYDTAALRELREEIGVDLRAGWAGRGKPADGNLSGTGGLERRLHMAGSAETAFEFFWVYCAQWDGAVKLNPAEVERGDWFAAAEIEAWLAARPEEFSPAFRMLWPRLR